ncbi:hypothetical protein CVT24_005662 [Panaeolus cyanescens]|uniref:Protein kinase domain-containing protein n=1 Tax=Panaeolus cyanescens TaxID=181874 RepID=A0A409VBQ7_9AGAR|nr:hypothetical protein CVT24_005662 [Panaeolus cyanescens]
MVWALKLYPELLQGLNIVISPYYQLQFPHTTDPHSPYYVLLSNRSAELRSLKEDAVLLTDQQLQEILELDNYQQLLDKRCIDRGYQACVAELLQFILDKSCVHPLYRKRAYKCLLEFSKSSVVPPSIFITGFLEASQYPEMGGGFADIYQGTWNGQPICCRVLRMFAHNDRAALYRDFCKEIIMWRQLCHPNILPFMGASLTAFQPRYSFIAPWLPNGNLKSFLRVNPQFDKFVAIYDIVEGLSYLHNQSPPVYHKDIKAANVLVSNEGVCVLADFGLTSIVESQLYPASPSEFAGSVAWSAPEVFDPPPDVRDHRKADIYSLACTIYEVITGITPWSDETQYPGRIINLVVQGKRPKIPERTGATHEEQSLFWLVERCWQPIPDRPDIGLVKNALLDIRKPAGRPLRIDFVDHRKLTPITSNLSSNLDDIRAWLDCHQPEPSPTRGVSREASAAYRPLSKSIERTPRKYLIQLTQAIRDECQANIQRLQTPITPSNRSDALPVSQSPRREVKSLETEKTPRRVRELLGPRPRRADEGFSISRVIAPPTPTVTPPLPSNGVQVIRTTKHIHRVPSPFQPGRCTPNILRFREV